MAICFIVVFALGMYVVAPMLLAWLVIATFGIQDSRFRFAVALISFLVVIDYWDRAKDYSPPDRQSTSWQASWAAAAPQTTGSSQP